MKNIIEKIIDAGIRAPSGDNCQPWRFEADENKKSIKIFLIPAKDNSLYSWGHRASIFALGACIENMEIALNNLSFDYTIEYFKADSPPYLAATLNILEQSLKKTDSFLYDSIFNRCTNRKIYKNISLTTEQINSLILLDKEKDSDIQVKIITDDYLKKQLGICAADNEKILFENQLMHSFFFNHVNWSAKEELAKRTGFYYKTLEIPPPAIPGFKLAKNWKIMGWLNKIGFANIIAKQNSKIYASSAAHIAIIGSDNSEKTYLKAGKIFERIWLNATYLGLSVQPLTGICLLMQRVTMEKNLNLSLDHINLIKKSYKEIQKIFDSNDKHVFLMLRVGFANKPSARTLRQGPEITWK